MTERDVFLAALEIKDAAGRQRLLEDRLAHDESARQRVRELLQAAEKVGDFLEKPAAEATGAYLSTASGARIGTIIAGKYKLREKLGEGGMGEVWVADQSEPVQRRVAIKLIKTGSDSRSVLARFEQERQALALMDHPNIAKVFDAGVDSAIGHRLSAVGQTELPEADSRQPIADGRPFFVMELIKGVPLTKYCDDARLSTAQRLELFIPVCQAVQHAHQKGVIHRDLKPSNILIGLYDGKPVPKVIDFGVAKATGSRLTDESIYTEVGSLVGTLEYMSPEQAELNNLDIDTRTDIYALGVILYELLTGSVPFSRKELAKAGLGEMLRVIKEVEPPRPSTKLSSSGSLPSIAAQRQSEPSRLTRLVKGDLDWIVMKALEKDRSRRYETANGFAADVRRHLAGEPVLAAPPSAGYRLRKFVRRNRGRVIAAGLVVLALLAGMAGTTFGMLRAEQRRLEADEARASEAERAEGERLAKLDAVAQTEQAQKRLRQIEKANDLLGSIFENLDPKEIAREERPLQVILVEKLDKAVAQLEGESIGDPLVVAAMQNKFGLSLLGLGEPGKAIVLLEKARATREAKLGPDHPETLDSMNNLALAFKDAGKLDLALPLLEETLKLQKAKLGPEHPETLTSMNNLAAAYQAAGKLDLALPLHEEELKLCKAKLGPEHPDTLHSMNNLAGAYRAAGKLDLALPLIEETLKLRKAKLGPEHPDTLTSMNNLALAYRDAGKRDLALPLLEETLKLTKAKLGPEHPDTLRSMSNLATAYRDAGKLDLAVPLLEETLKLINAKLGPEHPDTLIVMSKLASGYRAARKLDLALPLFEETLGLCKAKLGPEHPTTLGIMGNLGKAYCDTNQGEKAAATFKEFVAGRRKRAKPDDPQFAGLLAQVALDLLKCRQHAAVEELLRECLAIREKKEPDVWTTFNTKSLLGGALLGQKKYTDAEPLLVKGYEGMKQREKTIPPQGSTRIPEAIERLVQLYEALDKKDEAARWRQELEAWRAAHQPMRSDGTR